MQPGDWVARIAEENGVSVNDIVRLNPEVTPPQFLVTPGQVLLLREAVAEEEPEPEPVPSATEESEVEEEPPVEEQKDGGDSTDEPSEAALDDPEDEQAEDEAGEPPPTTSEQQPRPSFVDEGPAGDSDSLTVGVGLGALAVGTALGAGGLYVIRRRRAG